MCQNVYCHWHTRISPHGAYGSCGVDSKCVCFKCFKLLSPDAQVRARGSVLGMYCLPETAAVAALAQGLHAQAAVT